MIYEYLFYHSYLLALKSRDFGNAPAARASGFVAICLLFNLFAMSFLLEGFGVRHVNFSKGNEYKLLIPFALVLANWGYYQVHYRSIITRHEHGNQSVIYSVLVVAIYYGVSFALLLLAGLFRNKGWVFAR